MADGESFATVRNLKECETRFRAYMSQRYNVVIQEEECRKTLYSIMVEMKDSGATRRPGASLKSLNNAMLNRAHDAFVSTQRVNKDVLIAPRPNVHLPMDSHGDTERSHETAMQERRAAAVAPGKPLDEPLIVDSIGGEDFKTRLERMERERDALPGFPPGAAPPKTVDVAIVRQQKTAVLQEVVVPESEPRREYCAPAAPTCQEQHRFLVLNGAHRDVATEPLRYNFTTSATSYDENALKHRYRNVTRVEVTCLVLPMEISVPTITSSTELLPKPNYNHEFSFSYPYVHVEIGGFEGTVDGNSASARRALSVMVFDRAYKAPNGRGYVVLRSSSNEYKSFMTPLASLWNLGVKVTRPNGMLFNNSSDAYTLNTVHYDPQNRLYLRVVTDQYFDRNEIFGGDTVIFTGFSAGAAAGSTPDTEAIASLVSFMNRPEGHEVVQIGPANDQGFHKTFFILAPGVLDQGAGRVVIDARIVAVLQDREGVEIAPARTRIVNSSLQTMVTLRVTTSGNEIAMDQPMPCLEPGTASISSSLFQPF